MSFTNKLFEFGFTYFVPFGDKIIESTQSVENKSHNLTVSSKKQERARLATARRIEKAVKAGKADPSLNTVAHEMKRKAKYRLSELNYSKKQYALNQIGKALPVVGLILPGMDKPANAVIKGLGAHNLVQYSHESSSITDTVVKTTKFVFPMLIGVTSYIWMPLIEPMLDPLVIMGVAAGIIGSALALDGVDRLYNNSTIKAPTSH